MENKAYNYIEYINDEIVDYNKQGWSENLATFFCGRLSMIGSFAIRECEYDDYLIIKAAVDDAVNLINKGEIK